MVLAPCVVWHPRPLTILAWLVIILFERRFGSP